MKIRLRSTKKSSIISLLLISTLMCLATLSTSAFSAQSGAQNMVESFQIEAIFRLPHHLEFSKGKEGPLTAGPYRLVPNKHYTLTVAWEEGGERVVEVIERIDAKDATITEYTVTSGHPFLFKVPQEGLYMIRIPQGAITSDIIYVFQETPM